MPDHMIEADVAWPDITITGQQFIDRTRGFMKLLLERLPQFPYVTFIGSREDPMESLNLDLSNYDDLLMHGQNESREGIPRRDDTAFMRYSANFLFGPAPGKYAIKLTQELSNQISLSMVSLKFAPNYQSEELAFSLFYLAIEYWQPTIGSCGSRAVLREIIALSEPIQKVPIMAMLFRADPAFTKDLPAFVKVTPVGSGYVLQVLDEAPFADSPQGRQRVRELFNVLAARGLLDRLPPEPEPLRAKPPTREELSKLGIGGASAPPKPRRTSRKESE